jgi:hypothetical protein
MAWTTPRDWTGGEFVTEAMMDTHIRDNFLAVGPHLIARKSSDQSVTSSTVLVDDSALQLTVAANEVWRVDISLLYEADGAADLKLTFSFPTNGVCYYTAAHNDAAGTNSIDLVRLTASDATTMPLAGFGAGAPRYQPISVYFINSTNAGTLIFRWTQNASSATATKVLTHSTLWAVKLV